MEEIGKEKIEEGLLCLFAIHAPAAPGWFIPNVPNAPMCQECSYSHSEKCEFPKWSKQYDIEKSSQWPWYYAQEVLKRKPKG